MRWILGCIVMNSINFANPWLLLIGLPLALVFLVPFFISVRKENRNGHNIASIVMHVVMALLIAFAAAGTTFISVLTGTEVYVVADVSYSADKNLDEVDGYIRNLKLPQNSKVGLVCFGKDYELVSEPVNPGDLPSVKTAQVDNSQTDIASALNYAGGLFGNDVIKRIVLITDAKQTDESDTYAVRRAVDALEAADIRVDAIFLDDNLSESSREVQISDVKFTRSAFLNAEERAEVTVRSSYATSDAILTLYKDGTEVSRTAPDLTAGENNVSFYLDTSAAGVFGYEVKITAGEDASDKNNSYTFTQTVSADINVLAVTGDFGTVMALVDRYGGKCGIDIYENDDTVKARTKAEYINGIHTAGVKIYDFTEGISADNNLGLPVKDVPFTVEELCKYDEIILSDADVTAFKGAGEFVGNLDTAVSMFGKSLVTYGDLGLQNSAEDAAVSLGEMLPVQFGSNSDARLLALVVDSSYSMNQQNHFRVAKQVATRLAGLLGEGDQVCLVTFYGEAKLVLQPTDGSNRAVISKAIDDLRVQQGTLIGSGLYNAYQIIENLPYSQKQVMLITDGANFGSDPHDPVEVAAEMYNAGITTSVFDVGRKTGDDSGGTLLEHISQTGHGDLYLSDNQEDLNEDLFKEIVDSQTEQVIQEDTTVRVSRASDSVLDDIDVRNIPQISGFVNSRAKLSATTVLQAEYRRTENASARPVPLYSYWNYGNGKVSTFTGAFAGKWVEGWESAGILETFSRNVLQTALPSQKTDYPFVLDVERGGGYTSVRIVPATSRFNAVATIEVTAPDGSVTNQNFAFNQYYYYYDFASADVGRYDISVTYSYYDLTYTTEAYVNVPYADEYNEFASFDAGVLFRALNGRGQVSLDGELTLENDENSTGTYAIDLTLPLLIICIVLYVADIVVRKLKWEDVVSFFGAFKKSGGETK